ncbi:MAG: hypothetical protein NTV54_03020, partial [Ignavibacteriales bacterium]|nr:hypothetical protein [Ignavibacteriales bacterium]
DTSLLTAAFHIPMKTALAAVKKNIPDPASRNNEAGISAIDVLTAFSGDVVLEVVDVQPGKDLRGRTWPFPQFGLCAGVANAAVMRIASEYLVTHNIARRTSDRYEIRFGDLELFFLLQHKSLYVSNTRRLIQRIPPLNLNLSPVNSADVLSRFSVRIGKILPAVSPFVPDQRAGDLMTIAGNSIDAVSENAQVEGKGKRVTIAISMKDKKRNSLASLADMVLQLVERYVQ